MCGIAGIVALDPRATIDRSRLTRMRDSLVHRGPDGAGLWIDGPVGLAHRRLSIVDLSGGAQPMLNGDESACIVFNGEIYNHSKLRPQLEARGHVYKSRSDTETILHEYAEYGEAGVEQLSGIFAFAIWDKKTRSLLLARDRLGVKPLYVAVTSTEILFASEIKAILAAGFPAEMNRAVLPEFLANRFVASEETFFKGIRKLLPGRTLRWSAADGFRERRYWHVPIPTADPGDPSRTLEGEARIVREKLERAVQSQLMSDVPLGVFLSGGLDSSGLAALMARMMKEPLQTFSVAFAEKEANELEYARLVAKSVKSIHREVIVSPEQFFEALPRLVFHEDEPIAFPSSVPLHFVSKLAREHVKVVLTGEGADELFLGYNRYRVTAWNERLAQGFEKYVPKPLRDLTRGVAGRLPRSLRRYAERSFLLRGPGPRSLFYENFAVFAQPLQEEILANKAALIDRDPYAEELKLWDEPGASTGTLERMSYCDMQTYLVELLMKQDQMSMAASIESRVPFLDHELVEHVMAIPSRFKLHGIETKAVLRAAIEDIIPREIITRKKMGFPVPIGRWLREAQWPLVEDLITSPRALERGHFDPKAIQRLAQEHRAGVKDHGDRLWLLLNLELWQRQFIDGEASALRIAA